jgi:2-polyprenyl-3-methyl-5-hydroxy-6-metoxy-1,4-benzoquinol methylase
MEIPPKSRSYPFVSKAIELAPTACTVCNVCDKPGTLAAAVERLRVWSNVRKFKDDAFTVWRCSGCGSLHSAEAVDLNRYYAEYPPHQMDASKLNFVLRLGCRNRLRILSRQGLRPSHRILDYGCGGGMFLRFLKEEGFSNAAGYDAFVPAFAGRETLEDRYDAVVSWDVIEHVLEPREFFRSLAKVLRPGGLLTIGTPNADRVSLAEEEDRLAPELHQPYHRHILSEAALIDLGRENWLSPSHVSHRFYMDTLYPFINTRFIWDYTVKTGGYIDAQGEPPRFDVILRSPPLLAKAFLGYFAPNRGSMIISFRKPDGLSGRQCSSKPSSIA